METERLVVLAQAGNAAAMNRLLEDLRPRLVRWALGLFRSPDAAQDVVQEAMARVVANLKQLAQPAAFVSWAYTILRRCGIEFFRRQTRSLPVSVSPDDPAVAAELAAGPESLETSLDVGRCVSQLRLEDQTLLRLHYWQGLELREIAPMLGIATGAARTRLFRARCRVRELLDEQ